MANQFNQICLSDTKIVGPSENSSAACGGIFFLAEFLDVFLQLVDYV